jgi:hypothetical protein
VLVGRRLARFRVRVYPADDGLGCGRIGLEILDLDLDPFVRLGLGLLVRSLVCLLVEHSLPRSLRPRPLRWSRRTLTPIALVPLASVANRSMSRPPGLSDKPCSVVAVAAAPLTVQYAARMAGDEWWTVDDPAVFGPVAVEVKVGEIPLHEGDYLYARWESDQYLKEGIVREESLLLLGRDGETIEIDAGYVIQVVRPQGNLAGKVLLDGAWLKGAATPTRGPATAGSARMRPTREQLANMLPEHGEADLAERVLTITAVELERIGDLGGYYAWSEEALDLLGGSMGGTRALCLATIDVLEAGTVRDLRQTRTQFELEMGLTPELSDVELAQEHLLRLRGTAEERPRF